MGKEDLTLIDTKPPRTGGKRMAESREAAEKHEPDGVKEAEQG